MEDSLSGPTNRYLNILEDATRDFSGLLQKVLEGKLAHHPRYLC